MSKLMDTINLVPIYKKCWLCDHYDEDNMRCKMESCNCDEEIAKQIISEEIRKACKWFSKIGSFDCDCCDIEARTMCANSGLNCWEVIAEQYIKYIKGIGND